MDYNPNSYLLRGGTAYPTRLQIETTRLCNLKCPNCRRTMSFGNSSDFQSLEVLERLGEALPFVDSACVSGWGESLMGRTLDDLIGLMREHGVCLSITTNASLLNEQRSRKLVEQQVGHITVSLDAGTAEGYARLRPGSPPLKRILDNIRGLAKIRDAAHSRTPGLGVAMLFHDESAGELKPLIQRLHHFPVHWLVVQVMHFSDFRPEARDYRLNKNSVRLLKEGQELARRLNVNLIIEFPDQMDHDLGKTETLEKTGLLYFPNREEIRRRHLVPTCNAAWEIPFIDSNGGVYPCCHYPEAFGNLKENAFSEIWHNAAFQAMREGLALGNPPEYCLNCRKALWYPKDMSRQPGSIMHMGSEDLIGMGWYPPETTRWGSVFRWSRSHSEVFLKNNGQGLLFLEAAGLPEGQTVAVSINGQPVGQLEIPLRWGIHHLEIGSFRDELLHVSLHSLRARKDPADQAHWTVRRTLGMSVAQIGLCASPSEIARINPASLSQKVIKTLHHQITHWRNPPPAPPPFINRVATVRLEQIEPDAGWGAVETGPAGSVWRWSIDGCSRLRFEQNFAAGHYLLTLNLFLAHLVPTLRVRVDANALAPADLNLQEGGNMLQVPLHLAQSVQNLEVNLQYPTWRPTDVDPSSDDARSLGFMFQGAWIDKTE